MSEHKLLDRKIAFLSEIKVDVETGDKSLFNSTLTLCVAVLRTAYGLPEEFRFSKECTDIGVAATNDDTLTMVAYAEWKGKRYKAEWDLDAYEGVIRAGVAKIKAVAAAMS